MTREEAKELFEDNFTTLNTHGHYTEEQEAQAIDMAIKALEQEPCEDAISRAEAILQIQRHGVGCFDPDEFSPEQAERFVINMLNELPSVKQEPKIGHWISDDRDDFLWKCSNCNHNSGYLGNRFSKPKYNFCPNCGADMREEE